MLSCFFAARFGVLFSSGVLGCRYTSLASVPCCQWCKFFKFGCVECEIANRWSVAVLCMLHKIRCNPMHPLYGALPGQYTYQCAGYKQWLIPLRYTYAPPRCTKSQYSRIFYFPVSISVERSCWSPYSMVSDWRVSEAGPMPFYGLAAPYLFSPTVFHFSSFILCVGLWGWGLHAYRVLIALS